jgi:hypothetical protein
MALVRPVLHQLSCSNVAVRDVPKHEFWVQWSGSGAFVAKNSDATFFSELLRSWHQFGQFCIDFRKVTNGPKLLKTSVLGPIVWVSCVRCEKF